MKLKSLLKEVSTKIDWLDRMRNEENEISVGKLYAIFKTEYEPDMIFELHSIYELDEIKKIHQANASYIGTFKCVKK